MGKNILNKYSFMVLLLLVSQLVFPIVNAFAETNGSILPPSNLTAQLATPDDVRLTWSTVYGATGYNVYEIKDGQIIFLNKTTTTSFRVNNLEEGTYRYVVSTVSTEGESGPSAPVSVDIVYPDMTAPSTLTQTIRNGNDIVLNWTTAAYAEKYNLYQLSEDGQKTLITSTTARTYTVSNAPEGNYTYTVAALNALYGESPLSNPVDVVVVHPTMTAPGNFTYSLTNGNDVTLKWGSVSYATNYNLYEITDGQKVLRSTMIGTSIKLVNQPTGEYTYEIRSNSDRFGESAEGSQLSVTVSDVTMSAPSNFTYKLQNINDIVLTWGSVAYATSYKVYQIIDGQKELKSTVTGTSVIYTKMPAGNYQFEVYAYSDRFGESAEGSSISLTIEGVALEAPSNITYKIQNGNDIVLSWNSTANATSYKVYQIIDGQKVLKSTVTGTMVTYTNMPVGDYLYEVHSYSDRLGESAEGSKVSLTVEAISLATPDNLTYMIKNGNDIVLSWSSVPYATNYKIYQITSDGQKVLKNTITGSTITYTNLAEGDYNYEVHAYSTRFGESLDGGKISVTLVHPTMQAPANVKETLTTNTEFTLSWDVSEYATSYRVYQMIDGQKVLKSIVTGTSVTYKNMPAGDYTYAVYAYSSRFGESSAGTQLSFTLKGQTMQAPTNLTYTIVNGNDIRLSWTAAEFATNYKIYQVIEGQKVLKNTVTGTAFTYANMPASDYQYVVHAYSSTHGESESGAELNISLVHPIMQAPENLTHGISNGNDIVLRWNAAPYATAYNVYRIVDGPRELVKTVTGTVASFTNMPEGDYQYEVHSYSSRFGESPAGTEVSFTLVYPTMQAPENLTHSITNGNDSILRWIPAPYATAYNVYRIVEGNRELVKTVVGTVASFTNMPEGDYQYEVHSYSSRFGESLEGSLLNISLIWPVVQPPQISGSVFNANNITLAWPKVTWANEYRVYKITNNVKELIYKGSALNYKVYNLTEETHAFEVTAYSIRFGESKPSNRITETIIYPVMESPTANLQLLSETSARISWDFITYANGYNIYEMIDGIPVILVEKVNNLSYTITDLSYANHEYYVTSYSNSFGESEPSNIVLAKLIVDTEPPVTNANAPSDWSNQQVIVTLTATDNETGVANTFYSLNDGAFMEGTTFMVEGEGVHKVSYYSVDKAGNEEPKQTTYIKIDKSAPNVTINLEKEYSLGSKLNLMYVAEDSLSGIANGTLTLNGEILSNAAEVSLDKPGVYNVFITVTDQAGWTTTLDKTFEVYIPVQLEVKPEVIKENKGKFSVKAILPAEFETKGFDLKSVTLDGVTAIDEKNGDVNKAEKGHFRFNREDFNWIEGNNRVEFRGMLNDQLVVGHTTVKVQLKK